MDAKQLKRLAKAELSLRTDMTQQWAEAVKALRQAVPDWTAAVLELIRENESLRAQLAASKRKGRK